jgi:hypothetical protein
MGTVPLPEDFPFPHWAVLEVEPLQFLVRNLLPGTEPHSPAVMMRRAVYHALYTGTTPATMVPVVAAGVRAFALDPFLRLHAKGLLAGGVVPAWAASKDGIDKAVEEYKASKVQPPALDLRALLGKLGASIRDPVLPSPASASAGDGEPLLLVAGSRCVCPALSCRVVWCRVVSCRVVSCRVVSCRVVSCRVVSCRVACGLRMVDDTREEYTASCPSLYPDPLWFAWPFVLEWFV